MKIAICCSSSDEIDKKYLTVSKDSLEIIFSMNNELIFGARNNGIMGLAYRIAKRNNRKIIGIAAEIYKEDFKSLDCDTEILTKSVSGRTDEIINNSDLLIFFPGGIGTVYELMTAIEKKRSGEFDKPIIICNNTGFFDGVLEMLEKIYKEKFTAEEIRYTYEVINDDDKLQSLLDNYRY